MKETRSLLIIITVLAGLISAAASQATTIYTWEDENGVIHFSDQARSNATTIDIDAPATSQINLNSPGDNVPGKSVATPGQQTEPSLPPATISLLSPLHEQTIRSNEGIINVSAVSNRKLTKGHNVRLLLDGKPYGRPQAQLTWRLTNIDRGSHTVQAQVLKYGKVIASSDTITVFLHRTNLLNRKPPAITPK